MATKDTIVCNKCGKEKKSSDFYISNSDINSHNKKATNCKACMGEVYGNYYIKFRDIKLAIYHFCRKYDICFNQATFNAVLSEIASGKKTSPYQIYMTKLNSLGGTNGAGNDFDASDELENVRVFEDIEDNFEVTDEIISFWGKGYTNEDYRTLSMEYENLLSRFECDSYSQEMLFYEVAQTRLDIKKKRQQGASVDKELKTLQDLLGSANIKPAQESAASSSEQVTFGTLIKKFENEKPIPEPLEEWTSEDWIRKYVVVWFLGHLCKMMNIANPYKDEYEEEIGKYTIKPDGED